MRERLQKYLARAGLASRRQAEEMIRRGEVLVNGKIAGLGMQVDPASDVVTYKGRIVRVDEELIYLMLNKPRGVITTIRDTHRRPTVLSLLPATLPRVYPVGRLDLDTEGLLLLTNDGDFAFRLTHPKFEVKKTYHAFVKGHPPKQVLDALAAGVVLDDGPTAPAAVRCLRRERHGSWLEIIIHEGRKRQVRRMCQAVGYPVLKLKRVAFGQLGLGDLPVGRWRLLQPGEVAMLQRESGCGG
ncbi:MAG: rRNA pseudouridine synthase [Firmicutes bacterium]|nr:rRNA pseudouridine synthase [Bacillota bacterium]